MTFGFSTESPTHESCENSSNLFMFGGGDNDINDTPDTGFTFGGGDDDSEDSPPSNTFTF